MSGGPLILHIDMNAFFASVEQAANPELRGKPVVVCGSAPRTVVMASSYEAKAYGVKTGMTVYQAKKLCPQVILCRAEARRYADISARIFTLFRDYTPQVEVYSIDEAFLDVTGCMKLFSTPENIAQDIKRRIVETFKITCSIGIGPNKLIAKLASEMQKPDGLVRITADRAPKILEKLPVQELWGIGPRLSEHLHKMGIVTCGQLGRAPQEWLTKRFGVLGETLSQMGRGEFPSQVLPYYHQREYKSMGHQITLDQDTADPEVIKRTILQLSEQAARRLRQDKYRGRTVTLTLRDADFRTVARQKTLADYINDGQEIYQAALAIWPTLPLKKPYIRLVGVSVSSLVQNIHQLSLYPFQRRREKLLEAIDAINDRYGEATLTSASLLISRFAAPNVISPAWRPEGPSSKVL
jgi:DNA polymerase-4